PRVDLELLQPRRQRRRAARQHDLVSHPPRRQRGDVLRQIRRGAGPAAGTAHPDGARPLDAHRVVNPSKEGLMKRIVRAVVLATVAVLVWVATPAVSQPKVVRIGDLGSKVGVFEGYGKYQTMGIQMAVEELNAKGGVLGHRIEIISEDDETKPAPAVRKAEKLILQDRKSTRLNSSHVSISYAVFCLKKKKNDNTAFSAIYSSRPSALTTSFTRAILTH